MDTDLLSPSTLLSANYIVFVVLLATFALVIILVITGVVSIVLADNTRSKCLSMSKKSYICMQFCIHLINMQVRYMRRIKGEYYTQEDQYTSHDGVVPNVSSEKKH